MLGTIFFREVTIFLGSNVRIFNQHSNDFQIFDLSSQLLNFLLKYRKWNIFCFLLYPRALQKASEWIWSLGNLRVRRSFLPKLIQFSLQIVQWPKSIQSLYTARFWSILEAQFLLRLRYLKIGYFFKIAVLTI